MADEILTAKHLAAIERQPSVLALLRHLALQARVRFTGKLREDAPVLARIDFGRWIADCECGGASYVDPDEPIFYCVSCGSDQHGGDLRPVEFPAQRAAIEQEVLARPVEAGIGSTTLARALLAKPKIVTKDGPLSRSWNPDESLARLRKQNKGAGVKKSK